jgi:hypothetical protein
VVFPCSRRVFPCSLRNGTSVGGGGGGGEGCRVVVVVPLALPPPEAELLPVWMRAKKRGTILTVRFALKSQHPLSSRSAFFSSSCIRGSFHVLTKAIVHAVCDFLYLLAHGTPNRAYRCVPSTGLNISTGSPSAASKDRAHRLRRVHRTGEHSASPPPAPHP